MLRPSRTGQTAPRPREANREKPPRRCGTCVAKRAQEVPRALAAHGDVRGGARGVPRHREEAPQGAVVVPVDGRALLARDRGLDWGGLDRGGRYTQPSAMHSSFEGGFRWDT